MTREQDRFWTRVFLMTFAMVLTACEVANIISAVLTDSVWLLRKGDFFAPGPLARTEDPVSFWIILLGGAAFVAYIDFDAWRRFRRLQQDRDR